MVNRGADVTTKAEKGQQHLEPNHTHFLLRDDGTYYGYEIGDYRTRFVNEIAKYKDANGTYICLKFLFVHLILF